MVTVLTVQRQGKSIMRAILGIALVIVLGLIVAFSLGLLNIDRTRPGKLPVVRAEGGQLPGFDVKAGQVDIGSKNTTVDVPTVGTKKEVIAVPTVGVKKAEGQ
jgi:hypothetical protein